MSSPRNALRWDRRRVLLLLILTVASTRASTENATLAEDDADAEYLTNEELELELEQQPPVERRAGGGRFSLGWSPWSEWSLCSRSCDGGASHQLRKCVAAAGCRGEAVRYKICNMQPCPDETEFREHQCSAYNDVMHNGVRMQWSPHYGVAEPCALTCQGHPVGELGRLIAGETVVVQLAPKVQDGTRCRRGSLDMCIDGRCQRVGCDLRIGSQKKVDGCGVCGGDGSSCGQPMYHWEEAPLSLCSATCGGGYRMSRAVCRNRITGAEVDEPLCDASRRPDSKVVECNTHRCPAKWVTDEWSECSASCNSGLRTREVFCAEDGNGTRSKVPEHSCHGHKPRYQETCNQMECPSWTMGGWSGCSVSCGDGVQTRSIECRDMNDAPAEQCEEVTRPSSTQPCQTGIPCPAHRLSFFGHRGAGDHDDSDDDDDVIHIDDHTQPLVQPYPPMSPITASHGATAERLVGEPVPSESTFVAGEWGPCNVTCGEGVRHREVHCKIFLEFSRTFARLKDRQCSGPKPPETKRCIEPPCAYNRFDADSVPSDSGTYLPYGDPEYPRLPQGSPGEAESKGTFIKVAPGSPSTGKAKTYSWRKQGFTHCSASCLGGVQEIIIQCIRDNDEKTVSPYLCKPQDRPEGLIQTCNDHPCPPRWNTSDYQPCTKSCGIGIQTRDVNCIHEVTRGGGNTVIVPNNMCPQPPPPDRQYCNVLDCPIRWHTSEWTKCSKSCGGGLKTRSIECKQVMAQNHVMSRPANKCPSVKPQDKKPCNTKSCVLESDRPFIVTNGNQTFVQQNPGKKKVSLKIGGQAVVFFGTQIKIKCPVKRFNRTKIQWAKDHTYIVNSKKFRISKKGALRIQNVTQRDSGTYTCIAGKSLARLELSVKPRPGEFGTISSEEIHGIDRQPNANHFPDQTMLDHSNFESMESNDGRRPFLLPGDDMSHETPGKTQPKKPSSGGRGRTTTRPPPPLKHDGDASDDDEEVIVNQLDRWPQPSVALLEKQDEYPYPSRRPTEGTGRGSQFDQKASLAPPKMSDTFGSPGGPTSSSGSSRPMPHFQQLLANLQSFGNSRGHRMITEAMEDEGHHDAVGFGATDAEPEEEDDDAAEDDGYGPIVVLGKGTPENLKFDWMITEWSKCSQYCGGSGFQMRAAHCMVRLNNVTQNVDNNLCEDAGLPTPPTIQKCGVDDCPHWVPTVWSTCEDSRCFTWNTAMQRREVSCQLSNGTDVELQLCSEVEKPPQRQECYNDKCKGTWKVGEWSDCAAACEAQGIKYRILQCVWFGTKKPAGNACRDQPRPSVMKVCKGPPCSHMLECKDQSKYCQNVKAMNMCRVHRYQYQCCQSCRNKG